MNKNTNIKILVSYKDKHKIFKSDIITPIQTGRALSDEVFEGMIGDDAGDNISEKNHKYNELSAQYWAWKNYDKLGDPDYIGFMHYRRHFLFDDNDTNKFSRSYLNQCEIDSIDDEYLQYISDENIIKCLRQNDCILPKIFDVRSLNKENVREQFKNVLKQKVEHFDTMITITRTLHPEYKREVQDFVKGSEQYMCNMFVLPKNLFFEYCEFCFSILFEVERQIEIDETTSLSARVLRYFGEMLFSIFMFKKRKDKNLHIKELDVSLIENTYYDEDLRPAFQNCKNVIAMGCSNLYAPYLAVYLKSIYAHSNNEEQYDIVVLESGISKLAKQRLREMEHSENISLRFVNVEYLFSKFQLPISAKNFSKENYYRFALGAIFKNYDKVIFTDINLVVKFNINDLFKVDLHGNALGCCVEISLKPDVVLENQREYLEENFGDNFTYYNTDVMLVDIRRFNQTTTLEDLIQASLEKTYRWREQCVINKLFVGKITPLKEEYNFEIYEHIYNNFHPIYVKYMKALSNAKIYHFFASKKIWYYPETLRGEIWWEYAKQTPFYEEILRRLVDFKISQKLPTPQHGEITQFQKNEREMRLLYVIEHRIHFKVIKWKYALKKAFSFGEEHKRHQRKYDAAKNLLKEAEQLNSTLLKI